MPFHEMPFRQIEDAADADDAFCRFALFRQRQMLPPPIFAAFASFRQPPAPFISSPPRYAASRYHAIYSRHAIFISLFISGICRCFRRSRIILPPAPQPPPRRRHFISQASRCQQPLADYASIADFRRCSAAGGD